MDKVEELAWSWLMLNWKVSQSENLVCFPHVSMGSRVVEFYDSKTNMVFHEWFLTAPMVEKLLSGKNPKKVRNEYLKKERTMQE